MNEKRNFFRVPGKVLLDYRVVDAYTCENADPSLLFEDSGLLQLFSQMQEIDKEAQQLLHTITEQNRHVADYLKLLNRKIDMVSQQFVAQHVMDNEHKATPINISEGGLHFECEKALYKDTFLALRLIFLPSYTGISCFAKVVRSESNDQKALIAAKFVHLTESTSHALGKQIMQIQRQHKRSANDET